MTRVAVVLLSPGIALALAATAAAAPCESDGQVTPICGFFHPEDLEVLPGGEALLVGEYGGIGGEHAGSLKVMTLSDETTTQLYPREGGNAPDASWGDPACPGPPNGEFSAHGIHLSPLAGGGHRVLVVNHKGREAIEMFELQGRGTAFTATWRGCVVAPDDVWLNDVAQLPDGGFVASNMMPRGPTDHLFERDVDDRTPTGYVLEWQRESGWKKIPGSDGALTNGLTVSADGSVVYTNYYLGRRVVAIERATGTHLWETDLEASPDNPSWTEDGRLLVAAHRASLPLLRETCINAEDQSYCGVPYTVFSLDPKTGEATEIVKGEGAPFGGATVAVQVGDRLYMGCFHGDRMGRIDLKPML